MLNVPNVQNVYTLCNYKCRLSFHTADHRWWLGTVVGKLFFLKNVFFLQMQTESEEYLVEALLETFTKALQRYRK